MFRKSTAFMFLIIAILSFSFVIYQTYFSKGVLADSEGNRVTIYSSGPDVITTEGKDKSDLPSNNSEVGVSLSSLTLDDVLSNLEDEDSINIVHTIFDNFLYAEREEVENYMSTLSEKNQTVDVITSVNNLFIMTNAYYGVASLDIINVSDNKATVDIKQITSFNNEDYKIQDVTHYLVKENDKWVIDFTKVR